LEEIVFGGLLKVLDGEYVCCFNHKCSEIYFYNVVVAAVVSTGGPAFDHLLF